MRFGRGKSSRRVTLLACIAFLLAVNARAQTVNYRSIGINTGLIANAGMATMSVGSSTVTFSNLLPANVGVGDALTLDPGGPSQEGPFFVIDRVSHRQLTVDAVATLDHSGGHPYEIRRAYSGADAIQDWADPCGATPCLRDSAGGRGGDLPNEDRQEVGVVYNDAPFTNDVSISGSATDATRFMKLTVAKGHRHQGIAGTGAILDGGEIAIEDDFTVVRWLEVARVAGANWKAGVRVPDASNVLLSHLLVYENNNGIRLVGSTTGLTVRNCVIYSSGGFGIEGNSTAQTAVVENCTVYGNGDIGIEEEDATFTVRNTISMNHTPNDDFNVVNGIQEHNLSSDGTATGLNPITGAVAANEFVNPGTDFHLRSTAQAIEAGLDLSASFRNDIDNRNRPVGPNWDIGADEATAANVYYRSIGNTTPYTNNDVAIVNGSPVVMGNGTFWKTGGIDHGRGDRLTINGTDYTVLAVVSDTELVLTEPYSGPTVANESNYSLRRKFPDLASWEDCIDGAGNGGTCAPFPEVSSSLIADNRSEVGIAYQDSPFSAGVLIDGSTTDASHTIRLTADEGNRHYGLSTQGAVVNLGGAGSSAIEVLDEFVTVEWLRVTGVGATNHGVEVRNINSNNHVVLRNLLVDQVQGDGIRVNDSDLVVQIYNNIVWGCNRGIVVMSAGSFASIEILNNTIYGNTVGPGSGGIQSQVVIDPSVITVRNNISHSNAAPDYAFSGNVNPASSHNLSGDGSAAISGSQLGTEVIEPNVNNLNFVDYLNPTAKNLHLLSGSAAEDQGVDLGPVFNWDIDGHGRLPPWDIGADDVFGVTAVDLLRFEATGYDGSVVLEWETGSETDNAGFYVYRSESVAGPFERVSPSSVAGLGTSPMGALYRYVDSGLENGKTYYYELEDFELSGATERHGPVWATPQAGVSMPPELTEEPETSPSPGVAYGDPESVSFRELSRNGREVVLELITGGFYAEPRGDGTVRLTVPGLVEGETTEGPRVPVKRSWVEAIAGRGVRLVSVEVQDVEVFRDLHPMDAEPPGIEVSRRGTVRAVRRRTRRRANVRGMLPEHQAQVLSTGFQGDVKKAYVELAPLRYDARRGELQWTRRLVVRLAFTGRVVEEQSLGGSRGRMSRRRGRMPKGKVAARLGVVEKGLYGVSFEELFGRRGRPIPTRWLRLSHQGEPVAFHVDGEVFGRGKNLYFVSEGADLNPYGPEAVYELEVGVVGERMPVDITEATGTLTLDTYWQDVEREENLRHGATLLEEANQWFWETILNGTSGSYPFEAVGVVPSVESGRLELRLRGASPEGDPEFVLRVYLNEVSLEELRWSGGESKRFEVAVPPGVVVERDNTLRLEHATDGYSGILLDGFTCTYPRASVTESGRLSGSWGDTGPASVTGTLGPVVDATRVPAVWLSEVEESETGVRFWAESGHRYEVGVLKPDVRRARRMRLKRSQKGADYVLIGPREFLSEAEPLLALRRSQGLTTRSVALGDVWAEFGHGEVHPEAIREFLSYAYHEWKSPQVRYVVLLGDGTYDYKDYLGYGVPNVIPPLLARTSYLWTASDPSYGWVNGEDELPDIAIGRLPVDTVEETRAVVAKLVAFGEGEGPSGPLVLVADDADHGGDFRASAEELATGVLWGEELRKIYLGELGVAATRDGIVNAFDGGARLMSYVGHGGTRLWADEQIFDAPAVETLSPQSHQPIVLTINCYTGSFHLPYPDYDSLSEELVKVEDRGAIAAISPSGLSLNTPAHYLHRAYLEELTSGRHDRLGDAIRAAQEAYAATGALPELLTIYHLFGDPAMKLEGLE